MFSQQKLLEYLELIFLYTAVGLTLCLFRLYCVERINSLVNLAIRSWPLSIIGELLEPYITSATLYLNQCLDSIDYWGTAQARQQSAMASIYRDQREVEVPELNIKPLTSFSHPSAFQDDSPLLNLPTEIIDVIASYVLTPEPNLSKPYDFFTCYRRPGNLAPTKISTSLLQTCQFFYSAYWYLPWTLSTHNFYLTSSDRRPENVTTVQQMTQTSHLIQHLHPDAPARRKEVSHVQVFPQLYALEDGRALSQILKIGHFMPRSVTVTIRHADWWFWESDHHLKFNSTAFVGKARFPTSTTTVTMELESLERRKLQIDWMADHISRNWHFTRSDDVHLVADPAVMETDTWKGAATWDGQRWVRDEEDNEPNVLKYYIRRVVFGVVSRADDEEGYEMRNKRKFHQGLAVHQAVAAKTRINGPVTSLNTVDIERAAAREGEGPLTQPGGTEKASEVVRKVTELLMAERAARAARPRRRRPAAPMP